MTAPVRPPREGLQTLAPEIARIVEALARVQEERDYRSAGDRELQNPGFRPPSKLKP